MVPGFLGSIDKLDSVSASVSWTYNQTGTMQHKMSDMRISPDSGLCCEGQEFKLASSDVEDTHRTLGVGVNGTVRRGVIKSTGQAVAIKTLRVEKQEDRRLLLNEVKALIASQGCRNLVQLHGALVTHSGQVNLVLELMDRGSLADVIRRGPLQPRILAGVLVQVLLGLHHLHGRRLLHNDIKPGNVLLNAQGDVKVADFGITACVDASKMAVTGTQMYLAPEKCSIEFSGKISGGDVWLLSDVWSLGVLTFEMASSRHPFNSARTIVAIWDALLYAPEPRLSQDHPAALCHLVSKCLTREVGLRPTVAELLHFDFVTVDVSAPQELSEWLGSSLG